MLRISEQFVGFCKLNDLSQVHNCHTVADVSDYRKVMGDKQIRPPQ
jgi:hypothetical protein